MNSVVTLDTAGQTDLANKTLHATTQQAKKDVSIAITATGTKDIGDKATGKMTVTRTSVSSTPIPVPVGTTFTAGPITFVSTESTTLAGTTIGPGGVVQDSATIAVAASSIGDESNVSARAYQPSVGGISAQGSAMAGGSHKQVQVVTQNDVQKATDQLSSQDTSGVKKQLASQFSGGVVAIDQSFKADTSAVVPTPAVDQQAPDGKAVLAGSVSYTLTGVGKNEIDQYLNAYYTKQLKDSSNQRVYDNGAKAATFTNVAAATSGYTATMVATAKIGPTINDADIKNAAKGKNYGAIQSTIEAIQGVDNVDIKFWPFWVTKAPADTKRITVEFNLNGK
jgi:hypothetical protein